MKRIAFFIPHIGCPRQCVFCNQNSISGASAPPTLEEIRNTLDSASRELGRGVTATEIAFFGGSFTALPREQRNSYLMIAKEFCQKEGFAGIRFSTRPDCITPSILEELQQYPIVRIELGVQSMDDRVLMVNQRGHSVADTHRAVELLQQGGIPYTLQMMVGLLGDTLEGARETATQLVKLQPDEVRIYPTLVIKDTELAVLYQKGEYTPLTIDEAVDCCSTLLDYFTGEGIRVIRLGLHEEEGLADGLLAGPYHPAFRELCEGQLFYDKIIECLLENNRTEGTILVHPKDISKVVGHGGWVKTKIQEAGFRVDIRQSDQAQRNQPHIG